MEFQHSSLAEGKWHTLSLVEQLGNIGSEVSRAIAAQGNERRFWGAVARALELFYLTIADPRWKGRLKELTRARELFCSAVLGSDIYKTSLEDLDNYFYPFALLARASKEREKPPPS